MIYPVLKFREGRFLQKSKKVIWTFSILLPNGKAPSPLATAAHSLCRTTPSRPYYSSKKNLVDHINGSYIYQKKKLEPKNQRRRADLQPPRSPAAMASSNSGIPIKVSDNPPR